MSLCIDRLTKRYNEKTVIASFTYTFPACGLFAVIGKSGEGKTTLLRMIASLTPQDGGSITGNERVSYAFQEHRLIGHLTAKENLTHVLFAKPHTPEAQDAASDMLSYLGLTAQEQQKFPSQLSGGMRQRVSLARAFLCDAPILLLDEPFKELDAALRLAVLQRIQEESRSRLVILTAHDKSEAQALGAVVLSLADTEH